MLCARCGHKFTLEDILSYSDGADADIIMIRCSVCKGIHYLTLKEVEE